MKKVLISIRPKWCEKIAKGEKTIEVRKSAPKGVPFKAYIASPNSKIKSRKERSYSLTNHFGRNITIVGQCSKEQKT